MARVIIDAGPLIAFAKVNQTDLFQYLFGNWTLQRNAA